MKTFLSRAPVLAALVASAALIVGCGSTSTPTSASNAGSTTGGRSPILLGATLSQSGLMAQWDDDTFIKLAINDVNKSGGVDGRPLKLITCNQQTQVSLGTTCTKQVLAQGAQIIIAANDFGFGSPSALTASAVGKLSISLGAESTRYTPTALGKLAFTAGTAANEHGAIMAEWAYLKRHWTRAYLLTDTIVAYQKEVCQNYFAERFKQLGGTIVGSDTFADSDPSIPAQITRIKAANPQPQVIVLCSTPPGGPAVVRELRGAGINLPILSDPSGAGTQYPKATPGLSKYYWPDYVSQFGNDPSAIVNALTKRYEQAAGQVPPNGSIYGGYDLVYMLKDAIEQAGGSLDGAKLASVLQTFHNRSTPVFGASTYTATQHWRTASMVMLGWQNGKPVVYGRYSPMRIPPACAGC